MRRVRNPLVNRCRRRIRPILGRSHQPATTITRARRVLRRVTLPLALVAVLGTDAAGCTTTHPTIAHAHRPELRGLSPSSGPATGGRYAYIVGRYFSKATTVYFGPHRAKFVDVLSSSRILVISPPGHGTVDVSVHTVSGVNSPSPIDKFTYSSSTTSPASTAKGGAPDHVVVVVMENYGYSRVIGSPEAPYINRLATEGALFTNSYGVSHPSEPNYLSLYSGSTHGTDGSDTCQVGLPSPSLGGEAQAAGISIKGYFESLGTGNPNTTSGLYACRHNPMAQFKDSAGLSTDFRNFPTDFSQLPKISIVVPNTVNDMHDQGVRPGDAWLQLQIDPYAQWAKSHNSLLIVTWDENDSTSASNQVATIFLGQSVKVGAFSEHIDHTNVLATIDTSTPCLILAARRLQTYSTADPSTLNQARVGRVGRTTARERIVLRLVAR